MDYLKFNINDSVKVRLTEYGKRILAQQAKEFFQETGISISALTPQEDEEGYSQWQLWTLMQSLGPHMGNGLPLVIETTILIPLPNQETP